MEQYPFERSIVQEILAGMKMPKKLLHIIIGPRQIGKTTAALQVAEKWKGPVINASADQPLPPGPEWIRGHWERAFSSAETEKKEVLLILDEIQKVQGWSETVKFLWDHTIQHYSKIQVLLLGSSSLLIQKGVSESLAGRFFLYRCTHWSMKEMASAFGWDFNMWLHFGGYPGAAQLAVDEKIWRQYVTDSLIETVLAKDVLQLQKVTKPALLRHLFLLACGHPAQILSYNKMLGQLHDAGNTTTLAHYVKLLEAAFLLSGLEQYKKGTLAKKGSSPKLILWDNALITAVTGFSLAKSKTDLSWRGRLVENAVGAHLLSSFSGFPYSVYYWRQRHDEVDFVVENPRKIIVIEVKTGRPEKTKGMQKFCATYPEAVPVIIGSGGIPLDMFFSNDPKNVLGF